MPDQVLIDTNVLLDCAIPERSGHVAANLLFDEIAYGEVVGKVAATSLKDAYYVLSKCFGESDGREFIEAAMRLLDLVTVDLAVCQLAVRSNEPDFEDGLIRACAEAENVDFIISRDEAAFAHSTIRKLSAKEYVELFCPTKEVAL